MIIQTKYLGDVTIEKDKIVKFAAGLPGFIEETEFVLLDIPGNPVFQFLQSVKTAQLAFVVANPYQFYKDYTFKLDDSTVAALEIASEDDVFVSTIVTLKDPFESSTINLRAPLIINQKKMLGKQFILNLDEYPSTASIQSIVEKGV
ncbi:flagellar assembly protein FliW [Ornithinibacillus contaminans]|uniref:flagellar assembly protein FliW n=1 Tax=Ornithinibacillus contaminans TaxID=694055 RepID=UPI00064DD52E|nr:flagellar assembly protein FliW [Ornithinibacillus contaminans]